MKILLIEPPFARFMGFYRYFFPFSLASLSAYLKPQGHDVLIYDADHAEKQKDMSSTDLLQVFHKYLEGIKNMQHPIWAEVESVLKDFQPDLIGITYMSTKMGSVANLVKIAKRLYPETPVVIGGAHPSVLYSASLKQTQADFVVLGEGEVTFSKLIQFLEQGKTDYENLQGIAFIREDGQIVKTSPQPLINDLDSLPFPDRDSLYRLDSYRTNDMGMIMTSRGCPFNCTFCSSLWERRTRFRSVANIVAEIEYLMQKYNTHNIYFKDDTFTVDRKRIFSFCDAIKEKNIKINWECLTRIELIDEELILRMRETGMFNLKIGIETGSERLLQATNKNLSLKEIRRGATILNKLGEEWSAFFMLGYPDETEAEIQQTWDLIEEIQPTYVSMSILVPYPGCDIYNDLENAGVLNENTDWNLFDPFSLYANSSLVFDKEKFQELARATMKFVDDYNLHSSKKSPKIT